ncbi:DNA cytosine methyltransferase [Natrinema sp. H-ect1]|uniref:DNA cytosine methyltransferase n=1 Tax=Natrinema sp. H-ect1 TaxID=3242700 RepID=UPI00359E9ADE
MSSDSKLTALDLFCGAGGLSLGLEQAGIEVVAGVDADQHAISTYSYNHKDRGICLDLTKANPHREIAEQIRQTGFDPMDIDLVVGGPPCKGFSQANSVTQNQDNPLNVLPELFLEIAENFDPRGIILENVPPLLTMEEGQYKRKILDTLQQWGFDTRVKVLHADEYGVPQLRRRVFFMASSSECPQIPETTHNPGAREYEEFEQDPELNDPIPVRDAIYDLPRLPKGGGGSEVMEYDPCQEFMTEYVKKIRSKMEEPVIYNHRTTVNRESTFRRFKYVSQGGNWEDIPAELMSNYKNRSQTHDHIYRRLKPNMPAYTVANFRKQMMIHPLKDSPGHEREGDQDRLLSVREAARLQSFPDHYRFVGGSFNARQQMVGNAVPVRLAKAVGKTMVKTLSGSSPSLGLSQSMNPSGMKEN